jgi:hypothetical protein
MSASVEPTVETTSERSARATRQLCEALGLGTVKAKDLPLLTIALAEVATREAWDNVQFADRVRSAFRILEANRPKPGAHKKPSTFEALVAVGPVDLAKLRPNGTLDPYALHTALGSTQSRQVLNDLMLEELKQSAALVEQRNPGTAPTSRRAKKALVTYIMEHVTNPNS